MHTLIEKNGKLYVEFYNVLWNEPKAITSLYRVTVSDNGDVLGHALNQPMNYRNGIFESRTCSFRCGTDDLPESSTETVISKPRGRTVRWYEGEWQKLTRKGWTYAY